MSKMDKIDQLLKESFEGFKPDAPNVWNQVSSQVSTQAGNAAGQTGMAGKAVAAFKSASVIVKTAIILSVPAIGFLGYQILNDSSEKQPVVSVVSNQPAIGEINQSVPMQPDVPVTKEVTTKVASMNKEAQQSSHKVQPNKDEHPLVQTEEMPTEHTLVPTPTNQTLSNQPVSAKPLNPTVNSSTRPKMYDRSERSVGKDKSVTNSAVQEMNEEVIIPNVFTPNGDGDNDEFKILGENITASYLKIIDSEGNIVFESTSKGQNWDGKNNITGQPCEKGIYTYLFVFEFKNGSNSKKSGKIELIR